MSKDETALGRLPCPRFELRWFKTGADWRERECVYSLVIPLQEHDIRRENEDGDKVRCELSLEIGRTRATGGRDTPPVVDGMVDTPFRDSAHAYWDQKSLGGGIPIVAVCEDVWSPVVA